MGTGNNAGDIGCFTFDISSALYASGNGSWSQGHLKFNASLSNERYSDSATEVNPLYESVLFYVKY